ncbi:MAG TPA: carboxypeptidase regulatory-like domain-containing protein, partial [Candidatus Hydrogenedens sp.]|nr:carboxypeptidase regulatory-like domain-containing protein [Candidatus Hydrogenedens sp.]
EPEGSQEGEIEPNVSIMGWIKNISENPIGYARIELLNTAFKVYSDPSGLYTINDVPDGTYTLFVSKEGYANYSIQIETGSVKPLTVNVTLIQEKLVDTLSNSESGGTVVDEVGNEINFPPNSLFTGSGEPVIGDVDVYITPLDLTNLGEVKAFPGGFRALAQTKDGEQFVSLESFALADFTIKQNGEELVLNTAAKQNNPAEISLALPDNTPLTNGQEVPLWYFDEEQGIWIQAGTGIVVEEGGKKYYTAQIQHLSWWNCDAPITDKTCITGVVKNDEGDPVAGAVVNAIGVSYNGITTGYTDDTGSFCVNVKGNSTVKVEVLLPGARTTVFIEEVNAKGIGNSCETGNCINIGEITADFDSCVQGKVTNNDGTPVPNAVVRSSLGTETTTDNEGNYCLNAISNVPIAVFVLTRPPVTVIGEENTSCTAGNCTVADIIVEYPQEGSYVGVITITQQKIESYVKFSQYYISPSALFVSFPSSTLLDIDDQCSITQQEYHYEEGEEWTDLLEGINWSGLDPGSPGAFSFDTITIRMLRGADVYGQEIPEILSPIMYSMFTAVPDSYQDLYTNTEQIEYTFSWPGGLDISAFTVSGKMPEPPVVTSPQITTGTYGGNSFEFDPTIDMVFTWNPPTNPDGNYVSITISSSVWNEETQIITVGTIYCYVNDDGSHIIPKELLQQLPMPTDQQYNAVSLMIARYNVSERNVPLTKGGNGKIELHSEFTVFASSQNIPIKSEVSARAK